MYGHAEMRETRPKAQSKMKKGIIKTTLQRTHTLWPKNEVAAVRTQRRSYPIGVVQIPIAKHLGRLIGMNNREAPSYGVDSHLILTTCARKSNSMQRH